MSLMSDITEGVGDGQVGVGVNGLSRIAHSLPLFLCVSKD